MVDRADDSSRRTEVALDVERAVRDCLPLVGVDGGGVALVTTRGHRATVCATDDVAGRVEELQWLLGEGPCVDASTFRTPVIVADLLDASEGVQARWPGFLDGAAEAGVRAVFALPLRIGAISLGAVDLYRTTPGGLSADNLRNALLSADRVSLLLLDLATGSSPLDDDAWQHSALRFRVHGAAGMVKVQLGVSIELALAQLRAVAFAQGRSVADVADDVVNGRLRFPQEDA